MARPAPLRDRQRHRTAPAQPRVLPRAGQRGGCGPLPEGDDPAAFPVGRAQRVVSALRALRLNGLPMGSRSAAPQYLAPVARRAQPFACIAAVAGLLWLVIPFAFLSFDTWYAVVWGNELAHG